MIIVLMAMAQIFGSIMSIERIPTMVAEFILSLTTNKILVLILINILLLIVGTFMEALAAIYFGSAVAADYYPVGRRSAAFWCDYGIKLGDRFHYASGRCKPVCGLRYIQVKAV